MTSDTGRTGMPREAIPSMMVLKSAWLHSVVVVALPATILWKHRISHPPCNVLSSPPPALTSVVGLTRLPADSDDTPLTARRRLDIAGGNDSTGLPDWPQMVRLVEK